MTYKMPPLEKGDTVYWYPDAEVNPQNAVCALVAEVSGETVLLNLVQVGCRNFTCRDCVRHVSDPWLVDHPAHKGLYGAWDYSPLIKRLMAVEGVLEDLTSSKPKGKA